MLYLGTQVLILLDLSYVSRFWTQFEAWLSMQFATPNGLKTAVGTLNERQHIVAIQNAAAQSDMFTKMLIDQWADKTPQQAFEFLSKPDVTVTNQSDKDGQLLKIKLLGETVQSAFKAVDTQLQLRVEASEEAAAHAKATLAAFEVENDVQAGEGNPLKAAATRAEREAALARTGKEEHQQAIARGMRPAVIEREKERQLVDEVAQKLERSTLREAPRKFAPVSLSNNERYVSPAQLERQEMRNAGVYVDPNHFMSSAEKAAAWAAAGYKWEDGAWKRDG